MLSMANHSPANPSTCYITDTLFMLVSLINSKSGTKGFEPFPAQDNKRYIWQIPLRESQ